MGRSRKSIFDRIVAQQSLREKRIQLWIKADSTGPTYLDFPAFRDTLADPVWCAKARMMVVTAGVVIGFASLYVGITSDKKDCVEFGTILLCASACMSLGFIMPKAVDVSRVLEDVELGCVTHGVDGFLKRGAE